MPDSEDPVLLSGYAAMQAYTTALALHSMAEQTELPRRYAYELEDITFRLLVGWAQLSGNGHLTDSEQRLEALVPWLNERREEVIQLAERLAT